MQPRTLFAIALFFGVSTAFSPLRPSRALPRTTQRRAEELDEAELEELETRKEGEILAKKLRSNMYNENGVAYAPWMVNQIDDEAYEAAKMMRKQRKLKQKAEMVVEEGAYFTTDLQGDELSGLGLKIKVVDEEVELSWSTDNEAANLGYKVQKRAARSEKWEQVASYEDWAPLQTKGVEGGSYTLLDPDTEEGDWIYRVVDVDTSGKTTVLCQALIEVQSQGDKIVQTATIVSFAVLFFGFCAAGMLADPVQYI